ncbi:MAG TPA: type II secretion system protein GspJ [Tepidisphaeraceae bacterium]|jgi:type II secretion system protein J|nr:type II secretion system protein GspJ [Tepidisphaeraceae bacterium]
MSRKPSQLGFTLLELILAMGMISMLAVSLYATLRVAFKARDSATSGIAPMRSANVALDLLGQDIESALPPTGLLAGAFLGQHLGDVQISQDTIEFYCIGSSDSFDPPRSAGFRKIDLGLIASLDGRAYLLVRRITSNLLSPQEVQPEEEILCRNVRSFALRYFDGSTWYEDWDSTQMGDILPVAVQVDLQIQTSPDAQAPLYHASRVFAFACHTDATTTSTGATGATGSTGGTGSTGSTGGRR